MTLSPTLVLPLAFWATSKADAHRQALEWAAKDPRIESASVQSAEPRWPGSERYTVTLNVTWRAAAQRDFGLGGA